MSRSHRRTPITGFTSASSERWDKQSWHRRLRRLERKRLRVYQLAEKEDFLVTHFREVSNVWDFGKDGKTYHGKFADPLSKVWRK